MRSYLDAENTPDSRRGYLFGFLEYLFWIVKVSIDQLDFWRLLCELLRRYRLRVSGDCEDLEIGIGCEQGLDQRSTLLACGTEDKESL